MGAILPQGKTQFFDLNGNPLAGGSVNYYAQGTTTPKNTYQDSGLTITNANPVVLDSSGFALIWGSGAYSTVVKDALGNTIYTADVVAPVATSGDIATVLGYTPIAVGGAATQVAFSPTTSNPATDVQTAIANVTNGTADFDSLSVAGTADITGNFTFHAGISDASGSILPTYAGSAVTLTGSSYHDFTIPSWATTIEILLYSVVPSAGASVAIRAGGASVETTNYYSALLSKNTATTAKLTTTLQHYVSGYTANGIGGRSKMVRLEAASTVWIYNSAVVEGGGASDPFHYGAEGSQIISGSGNINVLRVMDSLAGNFAGGYVNVKYSR